MVFEKGQRPWNAGRNVGLTCARCGAAIQRTLFALKKSATGKFYCGRECKDAAYAAACSGSDNPRFGKGGGASLTCEVCGKGFYLAPSTNARRAGRFCSMACYTTRKSAILRGHKKSDETRARQSAAMKGVPRPGRRKPPIVVTCQQCGRVTEYISRKRIHAAVRRFCTTDCWYAYLRAHPEAHGWFKGGVEPYYGPNWRHQARLARERDQHTCRVSGVRQLNPRLDVHHVRSRRSFSREDFEAMNALENLITVCKSCHTSLEVGAFSI